MNLDGLPDRFRDAARSTECLSCGDRPALAFAPPDERPTLSRRRPSQVLFCSDQCGDLASAVRYARATRNDGRIERPDVLEQVALKLGLATSADYSRLSRRLPADVRRAVFERDGNRCTTCGSTDRLEIDHREAEPPGDLNALPNLQLLCHRCHDAKTRASTRDMGAEHQQRIVLAMNLRVRPDIAAAPADDQNLWATVYTIIARARWEMVEEEVAPGILAVRKR